VPQEQGGGDTPDVQAAGIKAGVVLGSRMTRDWVQAKDHGGSQEAGDAARLGGRCSRCSKKEHQTTACTADVYCVICDSHDHMNHKCHLLKAPRPVAHAAAGYAVAGLGSLSYPPPATS